MGMATNPVTVTINNQATYRKGDYFRANYSTGAICESLTNLEVLNTTAPTRILATRKDAFPPGQPSQPNERFGVP